MKPGPSAKPQLPVGRLAPSPTGHLHLGHARSFLLAWWHARSRGGRIVLRLEDLDTERRSQEAMDSALFDLEWLGLDWDEAPRVQSEHLEPMQLAIERLLSRGQAYACICSRSDIRQAASAPQQGVAEIRYPGTCRGRFESVARASAVSARPAGVRFVVPAGTLTVKDEFAPPITVDVEAEVGDFLIARRSGAPAYQLAVVVDDAEQGITEIVRGDDLLASTARQMLLADALGLARPRSYHVPLVVDEEGRRLAKREDALSLGELRARNVDPRQLVRWVAEVSGHAPGEPCAAHDLLDDFDIERVPHEPVVLTRAFVHALAPGASF
jgi:glutamyl-tRNA synthetase